MYVELERACRVEHDSNTPEMSEMPLLTICKRRKGKNCRLLWPYIIQVL